MKPNISPSLRLTVKCNYVRIKNVKSQLKQLCLIRAALPHPGAKGGLLWWVEVVQQILVCLGGEDMCRM